MSQQALHDLPGNVGQTEIATLGSIGQPGVIEPERVEKGCVEVVGDPAGRPGSTIHVDPGAAETRV